VQNPSWDVWALGPTQQEAEESALNKAREKVVAFLHEQEPQINWEPSLDFIRKLPKKSHVNKDAVDVPEGFLQVDLHIELDQQRAEEILRKDRHSRMIERMQPLGLGLAGLVLMLAAIGGYIRLDEWSKGYYTGWLRLAVIGIVVTAIGVVLLFVS
jgi:hypothetical protein